MKINFTGILKKNYGAKSSGFTILEVILAIFILSVGVAGSFALIQQIFVSSSLNQSRLTASYLVQEGIEVVRNIRDSNWLEKKENPAVSWKRGLAGGEWEAAYNDWVLTPNSNRYLYINSANGFYAYAGDTKTKFKRKISISEINPDLLEVSVLVSWEERGRSHSVQAVEDLYNWFNI